MNWCADSRGGCGASPTTTWGNRDDAEEVAEQAFLNILDAADSYTPSARFTIYFYRVIANLYMDRTRKRSRRLAEAMPEQRSSEPQPDSRMADRECKRAVGRESIFPRGFFVPVTLYRVEEQREEESIAESTL